MDSEATDREILEKKLEKKLQDPTAEPLYLPLEFLKDITCDFSIERELGRGAYGVVYKGVLQSGKVVAVKKILDAHLLDLDNNNNNKQFQNEITCLMGVRHQNVVQLVGYCVQTRSEVMKLSSGEYVMVQIPACLLCFEFHYKGSLDKHVSDDLLVLDWHMRYEIIKGVCRGLHYLHDECHIVHLDLKPQNILMDDVMIPKIADFGLSRLLGEQKSKTFTRNFAGTLGYMAPEYIDQGIISSKADIFSLGVIIIEIITGCRDYPNMGEKTEISLKHYTDKVVGSWRNRLEITPMHMSLEMCIQQVEKCISIALKCLEPDFNKRPTSLDIVQSLNAVEPKCGSLGKRPSEKDPDRREFTNEGFFGMPQTRHLKRPAENATNLEVGHFGYDVEIERLKRDKNVLMQEVVRLRQAQQTTQTTMEHRLHQSEQRQEQMLSFLAKALQSPGFLKELNSQNEMRKELQNASHIDQGPEVDDLGAGSSREQGSPVLFNPQDSVKFLGDDAIPTDLERRPGFDGQGPIELQDIDIGSTSKQKQDMPQEDMNDNFWEKLQNEGLDENDSPVIEDGKDVVSEKMGYLDSYSPTSSN